MRFTSAEKKSDHMRKETTINLIRWLIYRLSFENHLFYVNFRTPYDIDKINNPIQTHTKMNEKKLFRAEKRQYH